MNLATNREGPDAEAPESDGARRPGVLAAVDPRGGGPAEVRPSRTRYVVLGWLCVTTAIAYIDRGCLSVAEGLIRSDLDLTGSQMGFLMSAFFLTYSAFQVPAA